MVQRIKNSQALADAAPLFAVPLKKVVFKLDEILMIAMIARSAILSI
jgi:hypothetical protein